MTLADDIRSEVRNIFVTRWDSRDGSTVPDTDDIALGNVAVKLNATVLYADLAESTNLVNKSSASFAAEVYKSYLLTVCRIIGQQDGEITAFDGDRVMAVFIGDSKNTNAAITALKINWAVDKIVNEELKKVYKESPIQVRQAVGIDTSQLWIARTGIRGSNDLVWVGRAANYAAKLCSLRSGNKVSWITEEVYNSLGKQAKYSSSGIDMWERSYWGEFNSYIYSSSYWWSLE